MTNDDKQIKRNYPESYKCLQSIKCSIGLTRKEVLGYKKNLRDILMGRVSVNGAIMDDNDIGSIILWEGTLQGREYWATLYHLMRE